MTEEKDDMITQLLNQNEDLTNKNLKQETALAGMGALNTNSNIIQYQLDSIEILDKLERFYKGEYIGLDDEGNQTWKTPTDKDLIPLNEFGVNSMMEIVTKYIDKNTSLSYYSEERIYEILADLGDEITLFIFCNYEKMGMDTYFKKTKFRILVLTTLHLIESTYRRAIRGKTSDDLNQSKIVTQSDIIGNRMPQVVNPKKKNSWWPF